LLPSSRTHCFYFLSLRDVSVILILRVRSILCMCDVKPTSNAAQLQYNTASLLQFPLQDTTETTTLFLGHDSMQQSESAS